MLYLRNFATEGLADEVFDTSNKGGTRNYRVRPGRLRGAVSAIAGALPSYLDRLGCVLRNFDGLVKQLQVGGLFTDCLVDSADLSCTS